MSPGYRGGLLCESRIRGGLLYEPLSFHHYALMGWALAIL